MNSIPSHEAKLRKLDKNLKVFGICNCVLGLMVFINVILMYFATKRAIQYEGGITTENYDYMLQAVRLVTLGLAPLLGMLAIWTGLHILWYIRRRKKMEDGI